MSTINSTYDFKQGLNDGHDAYVLPPEIAESLRVPKIVYPDNKIPAAIARKCFPDGLSCAWLQDTDGSLLLSDVMDLMNESILSTGLACASCRAPCEFAAKIRIAA